MKLSLIFYLILIIYLTPANVDAFNFKDLLEKVKAPFKKLFKPSNTTNVSNVTIPPTTTSATTHVGTALTTEHAINIVIARRDYSDIISSVRKRAAGEKPGEQAKAVGTCSEDQLMVYLAEIQAINPESIINLSTFDELVVICRQVSDSLDKMDCFLKSCKLENDKSLYVQLIKGVDKLYSVLCDEKSPFRKEFEKYFPCLKQLHEDFETCFGPPDWTESLSKSEICRSYKDIADCYYIKAAKVCGNQAAKVMKHLVKNVVDAIIPVHCASVMVNPRIEDLDGHRCNSAPSHILASTLMLLNIIVLIN